MARFWVGGSGNWSDNTNHWASVTNGTPGAALPTSADDVTFDASSGTGTVTINTTTNCANFDMSASSILTVAISGFAPSNFYGSFTLKSGLTWTYSGSMTFRATASGKTITTAGTTFVSGNTWTFDGVSGGWTLQDNVNLIQNSFTLTNGSLDTNGKTITCGNLFFSNTNIRSLTLGASTINSTGGYFMSDPTNLTFSGASSTINLSGSGAAFQGAGKTFGTVNLSGGGSNHITGANTFTALSFTGVFGNELRQMDADQIITGTFTVTGNSQSKRILIASNTVGTTRTLTAGAVSLSNVDFQDITAAGAASPFSGTSIGDALGNTNITPTASVTRYWVGNTGNWSDSTNHWAALSNGVAGATLPLAQDTVLFDANSITSASQSITIDSQIIGKDIDFTGVLNTPQLKNFNNSIILGSLTLASGMTMTGSSTMYFENRSTANLTTAGVLIPGLTDILAVGGALVLQDDLSSNSSSYQLVLDYGTFDANNHNLNIGNFYSLTANTRTLTMGSGTWTITGVSTCWRITTVTFTLNQGTSSIVLTESTSSSKTFDGGGLTYNNVTFSGTGTGAFIVVGSNTFNTVSLLNFPHTLKLTNGTTTTASSLSINGGPGTLMNTLSSDSAGSTATLSVASGNVVVDYVNIKDSTVTGGATFDASINCVSVSNNSGWTFEENRMNNQYRYVHVGSGMSRSEGAT